MVTSGKRLFKHMLIVDPGSPGSGDVYVSTTVAAFTERTFQLHIITHVLYFDTCLPSGGLQHKMMSCL